MITKDDVKKIATLAKLSFNPQDTERYTKELSQILTFVEKLNELDLSKVEATSHAVTMTNVFREDIAKPSLIQEKVFQEAPDTEGNLFRVPKVIG